MAAILCFAGASSITPLAAAQQGTTSLVGSVTDASSGQPVLDAVVTVTSPNLQGEEIAVSDESGSYRIQGLPPGVYTLRVESDTFRPYARTELDLHADTTIRLNVSLLPEAIKAQEVVVKGRTPTVDVGSSATGINITSEFTSRVPVIAPGGKNSAGRSFESVADVVPGAHTDAFGVSIFGSSSPENRYLLDGLSVNNPTFGIIGTPLAIDFIKEVSVLSGGYMPEYGRSTGGVVNAITKTGTNEWHGSVFTNWSPGAIAGDPKRVLALGQTISTKPQLDYQGDIGGDVGGPIIRDKLWIYAGFDWARTRYDLKRELYRTVLDPMGAPVIDPMTGDPQRQLIPGSRLTAIAQQDQFQGITKLTWAVNKQHRLNLSLNGVYPVSGGMNEFGINPQTGASEIQSGSTTTANGINGPYSAIAHKYQASSTNAALKWSAELMKDRAFLDTWLGYHQERFGKMPPDGSSFGDRTGLASRSNVWFTANDPPRNLNELEVVPGGACDVPGSCPVQDYRIGGPESIEQQKTHRLQGRTVFTYLFKALGHHVFKAGLDLEYQRHRGVKAYTGGIDFVEGSRDPEFEWIQQLGYGYLRGPDQPVYLDRLDNQTKSISIGGFIQDSWNVADIVTVNLGLRYDAQLMYGRDSSLAMALPNQWSPRVGAVWDPTQEGRAKVFTNYARYFETVPLRVLDRYLSGEPILVSNSTSGTCNVLDPTQATAGGRCTEYDSLNSGFGYPPNDKYYAFSSGTSLVDPKLKAPSTDEFVLGGEYEILKDGRAGLVYTKRWLNNTVEDMSRDAGSTFFFGNPGRGLARDFPKAQRKYDALTAYFVKQFSDGWLTQASYTLSWLRGNYGGLYRAEDLQFDPHQNSDFDLYELTANRKGPLPGDHRHYIKVFGAKEFVIPKGGVITPGASLRAYSGDPTNYLGSHPFYLVDQVYVLPRGEGERLPWTTSVDLRLGYGFNFSKDRGLVATIDIFNLFNFQSAVARDQRYTSSTVNPIEGGTRGDLANVTTTDGSPLPADQVNPNFGRVSARQPPRVFRFGLKGTF
ncbi:MAG: TonB-dependent receptor [Polyangiales bacterium]